MAGIAVLPTLIPDIPKAYQVYFNSFLADPHGKVMLDVLFPGGKTSTSEFQSGHNKATLDWWHQSDFQYTVKAVDRHGEVLGLGMGDLYLRDRSEEERRFGGCVWLQGEERARADAVVGPLAAARERLFGGARYAYLHFLAVDPRHQGRGAARALVQWALDLGESLRLPVYFESSPATVKLYAKMGFETLPETVVHDGALLGMEDGSTVEVPLMVKMPSGSMTFDEWRAAGRPDL